MKEEIIDNTKLEHLKDFRIPDEFRYKLLTPEDMKILKALPENQICSECKGTVWICTCNC